MTAERRMLELSELQLHLSGERARQRIGSSVRILIDSSAERLHEQNVVLPALAQGCPAIGRSEGEALDIDSSFWVDAGRLDAATLVPGAFVQGIVTDADVHDLRARAEAVDRPPEVS